MDLSSGLNKLIHSLEFKNIDFITVPINNKEDFISHQHKFLNNDYIVVDLNENILTVITTNKEIFLIDISLVPSQIYSTIFSVYTPRKIVYNINPILDLDVEKINLYNISLLFKVFYNLKAEKSNIYEILSLFTNNTVNDYNLLLYNLFQIKDNLNIILDRLHYMPFINKEMKVYEIIYYVQKRGLPYSHELYQNTLKLIENDFNTKSAAFITKHFDIKPIIDDKDELLKELLEHKISNSLHTEFLECINSEDSTNLLALILSNKVIKKYSAAPLENQDRLYIGYNTYNSTGSLETLNEIDNFYISSKKNSKLVIGNYDNLFLRIFTHLSKIPYLNEKQDIIDNLSEKIFKKKTNYYKFSTLFLLHALIDGYDEPTDIADYIYDNFDTIIFEDEIENSLKLISDNCPEILSFIDEFEIDRIYTKRLSHVDDFTITTLIHLIESDIIKECLVQLNSDLLEFNRKYKNKINIVGVIKNKFVLECNIKDCDTAVDILSRRMYDSYSKFIKKTKIAYTVFTSDNLKNH